MLISNDELKRRLSNPLNLLNKSGVSKNGNSGAMSLFIRPAEEKSPFQNPFAKSEPASEIPQDKPTSVTVIDSVPVDELIEGVDNKVDLALAHDRALKTLNEAIELTRSKMDDIKADKLPSVVTAMSKVVDGISRARLEQQKINKGTEVHHHFYMPEQRKIETYDVVEVG